MKKIIIAFMLGMSMLFMQAHAEPTFNQVQTLIAQQEYRAAEKGLEEIIKNHPNSAKAFYAMAQAQAGLGNLTKAQHALDKAMGLNPALDFAPQSSVDNLKQAIHPQVAKIEIIEESHFWRNVFLGFLFGVIGYIGYVLYDNHQKSMKRQEQREKEAAERYAQWKKTMFETKPKNEVKAELKTPVVSSSFASVSPTPTIQKTEVRTSPSGYNASPAVTPAPVVVNNTTSNNSATDFMLGAMMGHVLTANNSSHKEVVREKVIEREVPVETKSSSWDEAPIPPSRSSTWDSDSSSKRSSSWDDDSSSSSKSSSSWSSSSSDSSSSWDSGSSSSDSSSSSSSWD